MNNKIGLNCTVIALAVLLASCGGGGSEGYFNTDSGNNSSSGSTGSSNSSNTELLSIAQSKSSLNAGGQDTLTLTIRTLDKSGGVIPNANVKVEIKDAQITGASLSTSTNLVSNVSGITTTDISLVNSTLSQRINRTITVIISSGSAKQEIEIPVTGTSVAITSDVNLLEVGNNATVTLTAVDAVGNPLTGAAASLLDSTGNQVGSTIVTNVAGKAVFQVPYNTVFSQPNNKLELTGKITVSTGNQAVSNLLTTDLVTLIANVSNNVIETVSNLNPVGVGEIKPITVQINAASQAVLLGKSVDFDTTNGTVSPATATITNVRQENGQWMGNATTNLTGAIASIATVSAQFGSNVIYIAQKISAGTPATISLQSEASVLAPKANTKVIALVKDKNGSPVPGVSVKFTTLKDTSSNGSLSQPSAVTDSAGRATVIYTAGDAQTLGGGVEILASTGTAVAPQPVYSPNLLLTVATQSAFITVAQNHMVLKEANDNTNYYKEFTASVVDTAGNPIANKNISISLDLVSFYKGYFKWIRDYSYGQSADGLWSWFSSLRWSRDYMMYENSVAKRVTTFVECPSNEFPNPIAILGVNNSILGTNYTFTTDSQGKFDFKVRYGRNYSNWLRVNINASTTVSTKENLTALSFMPSVADVDVDDMDGKWRPDDISPYGSDYSTCNNYK